MKTLLVVAALASCIQASACFALSGGPVRGRVLEEGTERPISGAIVVVRWSGVVGTIGHGGGVCYHVEATTTKSDGSYYVPEWREADDRWGSGMSHRRYHVTAFKRGYGWSDQPSKSHEIVHLAPFKGTVEDRFQFFRSVISRTNCGNSGGSERNLYWPWIALYEEARTIALTPEQRNSAVRLKSVAESAIVDVTKPTKRNEFGDIVNIDPRDNLRPEPLK